jgi:hypothetical protein
LSFKSIVAQKPKRICIAGDEAGKISILKIANTKQKEIICFHQFSPKLLKDLGLTELETQYSEFGQERFIKLTTFKWDLILQSLKKHKEADSVVFSDLDVLWMNSFEPRQILNFQKTRYVAAIQDDSPKGRGSNHFCTGIMIWSNSSKSHRILSQLFRSQYDSNASGRLIPDEPIFNNFYQNTKDKSIFSTLDSYQFVIGHRFFHLNFPWIFNFKDIVAFHANYVIGDRSKFRRLLVVQRRQNRNLVWTFDFSCLLLQKSFSQISQNFSKLRRLFKNHSGE